MGMEKIRFLYLLIKADHAASLPLDNPAPVARPATEFLPFLQLFLALGSWSACWSLSKKEELLSVPKRMRIEGRRSEIGHLILCSHQDVRTYQAD